MPISFFRHVLAAMLLLGATTSTLAQTEPPVPTWAPVKNSYKATETKTFDLIHTKLELGVDWANRFVLGKATLTMAPWFYTTDSVVLDAVGFEIKTVAQVDAKGKQTALKYKNTGYKLIVQLGRPYTRGEKLNLFIDYIAKPELNPGNGQTVAGDKGWFFIDADGKDPRKPTQVWTQGETEYNSRWFPTFDQTNERCTQELTVTVADKYVTLSNGLLASSKKNADGTRTDYWKMDKPHAPYLFVLVIGEYAVTKDKWRDKEVSYYVEPEYAAYAQQIFGDTPKMIELFSQKLGVDFPWQKYSQVIVRDFVAGAMENTTAVTFAESYQRDDRGLLDETGESTIAHELFHQWFGDYVTCESWANLPLNESFANYSEYIWFDHKYGRETADRHNQEEMDGYLNEAENKREPLIRYNNGNAEEMFDGHSYNKGGRVLHMLRNVVGDEAFFASLKLYLERNANTDVEIHELRLAFEDVTGQDLNWFFNQWFLSAGHAELQVDYSETPNSAGNYSIHIQQLQDQRYQPVYRLPFWLHVRADGKDVLKEIHIESADTTIDVPVNGALEFIDLDSRHYTLGTVKENKPLGWWLAQAKSGTNYLQKTIALQYASTPDADAPETLKAQVTELLMATLNHPFWGTREYALGLLSETYTEKSNATYITKLAELAQKDPKASVRAAALSILQKQKPAADQKPLVEQTLHAAANDRSYAVAGAALEGLYAIDKAAAMEIASKNLDAKGNSLRAAIVRVYLKEKPEGHRAVVEDLIQDIGGSFQGFQLLTGSFGPYATQLEGAEQDAAIAFLKSQAMDAGAWFIRLGAAIALKNFGSREDVKAFLHQVREREQNSSGTEYFNAQLSEY